MRATKGENQAAEIKVWCESCSIRLASNERRIVVGGKTYHLHCYAKLNGTDKVDERLPE
jgi:hypothetical protein